MPTQSPFPRAGLLTLIGVAVVLGMSGCTVVPLDPDQAAPVPSGSPLGSALPPRPRELRLDGLDPCTLVPAEVLRGLEVPEPGVPAVGEDGARSCTWQRPAGQRPSGVLGLTAATGRPAADALRMPDAEVISVAGFAAVAVPVGYAGQDSSCELRVDVAAGQSLWVSWDNPLVDERGAGRARMCGRARAAAEEIVRALVVTR